MITTIRRRLTTTRNSWTTCTPLRHRPARDLLTISITTTKTMIRQTTSEQCRNLVDTRGALRTTMFQSPTETTFCLHRRHRPRAALHCCPSYRRDSSRRLSKLTSAHLTLLNASLVSGCGCYVYLQHNVLRLVLLPRLKRLQTKTALRKRKTFAKVMSIFSAAFAGWQHHISFGGAFLSLAVVKTPSILS